MPAVMELLYMSILLFVVVIGGVCIMARLEKPHTSTASQTLPRCSSAQAMETEVHV